jgi:hypothetical protein
LAFFCPQKTASQVLSSGRQINQAIIIMRLASILLTAGLPLALGIPLQVLLFPFRDDNKADFTSTDISFCSG